MEKLRLKSKLKKNKEKNKTSVNSKKQKFKFCSHCSSKLKKHFEPFISHKIDAESGKKIIVKDAYYFKCTNNECNYTWVPAEEVTRIENYIFSHSWKKLTSFEIKAIRESLGFHTKSNASRFLGMNEKAFVKMEQGAYSEVNYSTDLLLRLAVFSKQNYNFIKDLHKKGFKFEKSDYEMLCDEDLMWNYKSVSKAIEPSSFYTIKIFTNSQVNTENNPIVEDIKLNSELIGRENTDQYISVGAIHGTVN